ncbi:MAG TPA: Gfo/Idh/MocA family oxidoreductase [Armatimonadota bacterium]|nr:Gfo/Idh/MocA family oxidoreductase [Armatimonadota bacterium]
MTKQDCAISRRDFLKGSVASAAVIGAGTMGLMPGAWAAGSDTIKVGVIGCGGRGTGAAFDCLNADPGVKIVALGDLFKDRLDGCLGRLTGDEKLKERVDITPDRCFTGFDNYEKVIDCGVDMVILATPPGFRPAHVKYAVDKGKHIFMEKPVAVDAPGVKLILEAGEIATQKKLGIVAGTIKRHQANYVATVKRIHDGAVGDILSAQCYYNTGELWNHGRKPEWTDVDWQIRNWLYFTWLSGDHIVEQHVHNIDVINWALNAHPVKCVGMGGRQKRTDPAYGHIFDHFAVEYEYPNGVRVMSMCRQQDGCSGNVSERVIGTKGSSNCAGLIKGSADWKFEDSVPSPYVQEHADLIKSIRDGKPLNEARQIAESSLTAIMGRMSAYTGQEITWEQAMNSQENLMPQKLEFGPMPVAPVAVPGRTPFS